MRLDCSRKQQCVLWRIKLFSLRTGILPQYICTPLFCLRSTDPQQRGKHFKGSAGYWSLTSFSKARIKDANVT